MPRRGRTSTASAGYGAAHQRLRARLLAAHVDGTPCPCLLDGDCSTRCPCTQAGRGLPMHTEAWRNVDGRALQLDHRQALALGGTTGSRLMLATCNLGRGAALGNRLRGQRRARPPIPEW